MGGGAKGFVCVPAPGFIVTTSPMTTSVPSLIASEWISVLAPSVRPAMTGTERTYWPSLIQTFSGRSCPGTEGGGPIGPRRRPVRAGVVAGGGALVAGALAAPD